MNLKYISYIDLVTNLGWVWLELFLIKTMLAICYQYVSGRDAEIAIVCDYRFDLITLSIYTSCQYVCQLTIVSNTGSHLNLNLLPKEERPIRKIRLRCNNSFVKNSIFSEKTAKPADWRSFFSGVKFQLYNHSHSTMATAY